ncbi:curli-like amyloid fiber formation chaperone CsgH [Pelagibacterium limicola]|uniref:curli-like amyloid fiber formation chaperone CsgH n=1 Tax=Pelagibacterium limicola TaxID=2791022 RepID=UPI0018AFED95|nr:curli-like amyloid fiber formation chaperone CsgH [Pelagibacterium limicola]
MTRTPNRIHAYAFAIGGAVAAIGAVAGTGFAHSTIETDVVGCEVLANAAGGGFALEAVYHAEASQQGSYQFSVQSVGGSSRTNINQGGGFSALAGETVTLGRVTVGGAAAYDVTLKIDAGGKSVECGGRINARA